MSDKSNSQLAFDELDEMCRAGMGSADAIHTAIDVIAVCDELDALCEKLFKYANNAAGQCQGTPSMVYSHALQETLRMRDRVTKLLLNPAA